MVEKLINAPQMGLGTFPFSGVFSELTREQAGSILDHYFQKGGKYLESAPVYNEKNFRLVDLLHYPRESYFLADKCVTGLDPQGQVIRSGKHDHILRQFEHELTRLSVRYLDLFQAHIVATDAPIPETASALQKLKENGLIRNIGVSNVTPAQLREFHDHCEVKFVQNRFSLVYQQKNRAVEDFCVHHDIWLNPYQIIERGLLTDFPTNGGKWEKKDLRNSKVEYNGEPYTYIREWVLAELSPLARQQHTSVEALVIAWTSRQPQVKVLIMGATRPEQLDGGFAGVLQGISQETLDLVNKAYQQLVDSVHDQFGKTLEEFRGI